MSDRELEKIRLKKMQELLKRHPMPNKIVKVHNIKEFEKLNNDFDKIIILGNLVWPMYGICSCI